MGDWESARDLDGRVEPPGHQGSAAETQGAQGAVDGSVTSVAVRRCYNTRSRAIMNDEVMTGKFVHASGQLLFLSGFHVVYYGPFLDVSSILSVGNSPTGWAV